MNWDRLASLLETRKPVPVFVIQKPIRSDKRSRSSLGVVLVGSKMVDDFIHLIQNDRENWFIISLSQDAEFGKSTRADLHMFSNILGVKDYTKSRAGLLGIPYFISCCGNFINTDVFFEENTSKKYDLLYITKTLTSKRIELFIETMKMNPKLQGLLITFDMPSNENKIHSINYGREINTFMMNNNIKNLKHQVVKSFEHKNPDGSFVIGELDKNKIRKIMNKTRIYLLTSQTEGINRTFAEALSCNIPVIIMSDLVGGTKEIFKSGMGEISSPNVISINKAIWRILKNTKAYRPRQSYLSSSGMVKANKKLFLTVDAIIKANNREILWRNPRMYNGDLWTKDIYEIVKFD